MYSICYKFSNEECVLERDVADIHPTIIRDQHLYSLTDVTQLICEIYINHRTILALSHSLDLHSHILSVNIY